MVLVAALELELTSCMHIRRVHMHVGVKLYCCEISCNTSDLLDMCIVNDF